MTLIILGIVFVLEMAVVVKIGKRVLSNEYYFIYSNDELKGIRKKLNSKWSKF